VTTSASAVRMPGSRVCSAEHSPYHSEGGMTESNRMGDGYYSVRGEPMMTACRLRPEQAMPRGEPKTGEHL